MSDSYRCLSTGAIQVTTLVVLSPLKAHCGVSSSLCCGACQVSPGRRHPWAAQGKGELMDQDNKRDRLTFSIHWATSQGLNTNPSPILFTDRNTAPSFMLQTQSLVGLKPLVLSTWGSSVATTVMAGKYTGTFTHREAFDFIPGVQQLKKACIFSYG